MTQTQALEQQLSDAKKLLSRREMALRLSSNRDFKQLILEEFCLQDAARYAQVSGDPAIGPVERADALAMAQASGHLKRFLSVVVQMGAVAEREMSNLEEAIEEARAEEDGNLSTYGEDQVDLNDEED
jgi:hypothetical protein